MGTLRIPPALAPHLPGKTARFFGNRLLPTWPGWLVGPLRVSEAQRYDRRIQLAINIQGKKMQRRAEFLFMFILRSDAQASYQVAFTCPINTSWLL